jgi:hypothetical protein
VQFISIFNDDMTREVTCGGKETMSKAAQADRKMWSKIYTYDEWMEAQGIPIYRGYYIEDLRT